MINIYTMKTYLWVSSDKALFIEYGAKCWLPPIILGDSNFKFGDQLGVFGNHREIMI